MDRLSALVLLAFVASIRGQHASSFIDSHPTLQVSRCVKGGQPCSKSTQSVVLDSDWRPLVAMNNDLQSCMTGNTWNPDLCPSPSVCAENCALLSVAYSDMGISNSGSSLTLKFTSGANVGSRVYLLASETEYQQLSLLNQEFTFDVDVSNLPCGINGAVYLTEMPADGGKSSTPGDTQAGAQFGTGYCDSQCPQDLRFVDGQANLWSGSTGTGKTGSCCAELDIWEANSKAASLTAHPCSFNGQTSCTGADCGDGDDYYNGVCDKDGCDFNSWRTGDQSFLGPGLTVDTNQPFTVVTQFISDDGTSTGNLAAIKRFYVQKNNVIANSYTNIPGIETVNEITDSYCTQQKTIFNDFPEFSAKGGLAQMGKALKRGMVLALSISDDSVSNLLWLDGTHPVGSDASTPGASRGPCPASSGDPSTLVSQYGDASVIYSNIKWGDLDSTYTTSTAGASTAGAAPASNPGPAQAPAVAPQVAPAAPPAPPPVVPVVPVAAPSTATKSSTTTSKAASPTSKTTSTAAPKTTAAPIVKTVARYGQCGGIGYMGSTVCASPSTCTELNAYYYECL